MPAGFFQELEKFCVARKSKVANSNTTLGEVQWVVMRGILGTIIIYYLTTTRTPMSTLEGSLIRLVLAVAHMGQDTARVEF